MSTRLKGWIGSTLSQADDLESALLQMRDGLWLRSATGAQLDLLGRVYGEARQGRSDTDYRAALWSRAATVVNGTPDEICTFLRLAFGFSDTTYTPEYPGAFFIEPPSPLTVEQLSRISPAGIAGFPADYMTLENGEYETLENGELLLTPSTGTESTAIQDTLGGTSDTLQDTLGSGTLLSDTLEF